LREERFKFVSGQARHATERNAWLINHKILQRHRRSDVDLLIAQPGSGMLETKRAIEEVSRSLVLDSGWKVYVEDLR
jgi:hypothetical protein